VAIDGGFIREPQRRVWIENQRKLDLAMRLFNESRYTILEFLTCTRHVTPTFGVIRPQVSQSINLPPRQTNHSPEPVDDHPNNNLVLQARARELLMTQRRVNGAEITS